LNKSYICDTHYYTLFPCNLTILTISAILYIPSAHNTLQVLLLVTGLLEEDGTGLLVTDHPTTVLPTVTAKQKTEAPLLVNGDLPVEAAAEVSAEEEVEVAKIVVGVERWIGTETIHHAVIRILTDDA
jgi:hypothetical protein